MSVILRHTQYPLVIIYKDPKKSWDKSMADIVKKDIEENNFDRFTEISAEQLATYLHSVLIKKKAESEE